MARLSLLFSINGKKVDDLGLNFFCIFVSDLPATKNCSSNEVDSKALSLSNSLDCISDPVLLSFSISLSYFC